MTLVEGAGNLVCSRCAHPAIALYRLEDVRGMPLAHVCFGCILRALEAADSVLLHARLDRLLRRYTEPQP